VPEYVIARLDDALIDEIVATLRPRPGDDEASRRPLSQGSRRSSRSIGNEGVLDDAESHL
jgi:hypothetical protein